MSETSTGRNVAAEFVGTTIVMLGGPGLIVLGGDDIGPLGVAVGFGLAIAISIGVIGAVANPDVQPGAVVLEGDHHRVRRSPTGSASCSVGSSGRR